MAFHTRWPALAGGSLRRAAPSLFVLWTGVIGIATWVTWEPVHRCATTFGASAGVWGQVLLSLPAALLARTGPLIWVAALLYAQWALGRALATVANRRLGVSRLGSIEQLLIGQAVMVLVVFALGMGGALSPAPLVSMVIAIAAVRLILGRDLHHLAARARAAVTSRFWRARLATGDDTEPLIVRVAVALVIAAFLTVGLLTTLHPVWFYDALAYHLGTPNEWLVEGGFVRNPNDVYSHFPGHMEALATIAMAGGGMLAGQLFNFAFLPLLLLWTNGRRCGGAAGAMWARLLLVTTPVLLLTATQSKPDLELLLCGAVTIERTLAAARDGDFKSATIAGLFAGMCVASKYTAVTLVILPLLLVAVLVAHQAGRGWRSAAIQCGLWLAGATLVMAPWLLRNLAWTGNPVYPAGFAVLDGDGWSAGQAQQLANDAHVRRLTDISIRDLWTVGWELTFAPWGALIERFGTFGVLGAAYLWLAPLGARAARPGTKARWWCLVILCSCVFSFFGAWMLRFMAVVLPWIAVVVGTELGRAPRLRGGRAALYLAVVVLIVMANGTYVAREALVRTGGMAGITNQMSDEQFLTAMAKRRPVELGTYALMHRAGAVTTEALMLVGDTVHAYVTVPHTHASALNPPVIASYLDATDSPSALARALAAAGFSHLLYNPDELSRVANRHGTVPGLTGSERVALGALLHSDAVACLAGACNNNGPALYEITPPL